MYRLRAAVAIDDLRETHARGLSDAPGRQGHASSVTAEEAAAWSGAGQFRTMLPALPKASPSSDPISDPTKLFPHDIGMDLLGGVDFKKGCYIGQEVVSRMQHRGTARRRPVIVCGVDAPTGTAVKSRRTRGRHRSARRWTAGPWPSSASTDSTAERRHRGGQARDDDPAAWATYRLGESAAAD